jgi:hypothetical protein
MTCPEEVIRDPVQEDADERQMKVCRCWRAIRSGSQQRNEPAVIGSKACEGLFPPKAF